jgi:hypothetical protein
VAGFAVTMTQLTDWLERRLDPPPPALIDGVIERVALQPNEPLIDYLRGRGLSMDRYDKHQLAARGNVVTVRVRLAGLQRKRILLRWSLYDAQTRQRLRGADYNQLGTTFTSQGPDHAGAGRFWVPIPRREGRYFIHLILESDSHRQLDERNTRAFWVTSA